MSQLTEKKCVPCEGGIDPLSRTQAEELMKQLAPEWKLSDDAKSLHREWKFRNFYHTMSFVNAVAHIANADDHHPDLEVGLRLLPHEVFDPCHRRLVGERLHLRRQD